MKPSALILFLILISFSSFCQIPDNAISIEDKEFNDYFFNKENIPIVKGKVLNLKEGEFEDLKIDYAVVTPIQREPQISKYCSVNQDGTFELTLDYPFPYQQIWFRLEPFIYTSIYTNTELFIELDANILRSNRVYMNGRGVEFSGKDGELNEYLNNYTLYKRGQKSEIRKELRTRNMENGFDSVYAQLVAIDASYINENPSQYSWLIINERLSNYYTITCQMHWGKEMNPELFEKVKNHKSYLISNDGIWFYNYLFTYLKLLPNDFNYENFRNYSKLTSQERQMIDSLVVIKKRNKNSPAPVWDRYDEYANKASSSFLRDTLLISNTLRCIDLLDSIFPNSKADLFKLKFSDKDPSANKLLLDVVMNNTQTDWCKSIVKENYDESVEKLEAVNNTLAKSKPLSNVQFGEPIAEMPFGAKLYKIDNIESAQLLERLKSAFEGKALILDFWATWCGPCLRDLPYSKQLHAKTKDLPIEYIYLCTSKRSNINLWKTKIAELEIGGTHFFVDEGIEIELMNLFSENGFPSYVLINTKGEYKPGAISRMEYLDREKLEDLIK